MRELWRNLPLQVAASSARAHREPGSGHKREALKKRDPGDHASMQMGSGAALFEHTCCCCYQARSTFGAKEPRFPEQSVAGDGNDTERPVSQKLCAHLQVGTCVQIRRSAECTCERKKRSVFAARVRYYFYIQYG